MQTFRFDPEVSIPILRFDSNFRIVWLTGDDSRGRVQIMHLAPSGMIGRHRTELRQLFAVVVGSGWVSGDEGRHRSIHPGQAALWEPNEEHEVGSEDGLTAVCVEGNFEIDAVAVTTEIVVVDYDPEWPKCFERLRTHIWPALIGLAMRIDHVGSTSVPCLAAKPIIDMDIVVRDTSEVRPVIDALAALGYRWVGDLGVEGRQAFVTSDKTEVVPHHLYLVVENSKAHLDHVLLRDLLRADPDARRSYGELKRSNVDLAQGDMDVYVAAKADFVAELLRRARDERGLEPVRYWVPDVPGETAK